MKTWKRHEKAVAEAIGGQRVSVPWREGPDVVSDWIVAECKSREALPQWLMSALGQATKAASEFQLPIAVLHQKNQRHDNDLVVMRMKDFRDWFGGTNGRVPDAELQE